MYDSVEFVRAQKTKETGEVVCAAETLAKVTDTRKDVSALKIYADARRLQTPTMPMGRDKTHSPTSIMWFSQALKSADSDIKL